MSRFEFNTVLVSIVLAFAISEILTAWGRIIRSRTRVTSPALYVLATGWLLLAIVVHWFGLWAYAAAPFDRIVETLLVLLPALMIALVCFVWTPDPVASGTLDLEQLYFDGGSWTFPLMACFIVLGGAADQLVPNVAFAAPFWILLVHGVLFLGLRFTRNRRAHYAVLSLSWIFYLGLVVGVQR